MSEAEATTAEQSNEKKPRRRGPNKPKPPKLAATDSASEKIAGIVCLDAVRIGGTQALSLAKGASFEMAEHGVIVEMGGPQPNHILVPWGNIKQVNYE